MLILAQMDCLAQSVLESEVDVQIIPIIPFHVCLPRTDLRETHLSYKMADEEKEKAEKLAAAKKRVCHPYRIHQETSQLIHFIV